MIELQSFAYTMIESLIIVYNYTIYQV